MKNKLEQMKSLKKALKNYKPLEKDDKKDEVEENIGAAGGTSIGAGSVDMNPTGGPARLKKSPMRRLDQAPNTAKLFDRRYKGKNLLLTKFRQHAYGND
tara:strand:- start:62 stop:358 length:297 start_codon:yes stop_codon:yes gene_type:complete